MKPRAHLEPYTATAARRGANRLGIATAQPRRRRGVAGPPTWAVIGVKCDGERVLLDEVGGEREAVDRVMELAMCDGYAAITAERIEP